MHRWIFPKFIALKNGPVTMVGVIICHAIIYVFFSSELHSDVLKIMPNGFECDAREFLGAMCVCDSSTGPAL